MVNDDDGDGGGVARTANEYFVTTFRLSHASGRRLPDVGACSRLGQRLRFFIESILDYHNACHRCGSAEGFKIDYGELRKPK